MYVHGLPGNKRGPGAMAPFRSNDGQLWVTWNYFRDGSRERFSRTGRLVVTGNGASADFRVSRPLRPRGILAAWRRATPTNPAGWSSPRSTASGARPRWDAPSSRTRCAAVDPVGRPGRRAGDQLAAGLPHALQADGRGRSAARRRGGGRRRARRAGLPARADARHDGRTARSPWTRPSPPAVARRSGHATVRGTGERATELSLPLHGERLRGDALRRQLDDWTTRGIIEPSAAEAVRDGAGQPRLARPQRPAGRGARGRGRDGAAAVDPVVGRARRRGRPPPPRHLEARARRRCRQRGHAAHAGGRRRALVGRATSRPTREPTCCTACRRSPTGSPRSTARSSSATTCMPMAPRTSASPPPSTRSASS